MKIPRKAGSWCHPYSEGSMFLVLQTGLFSLQWFIEYFEVLLTVRIEVVPLLVAPNNGATLFLSVVGVSKPILCASL